MNDDDNKRMARLEYEIDFLQSALFEAADQISRLIEQLDALAAKQIEGN